MTHSRRCITCLGAGEGWIAVGVGAGVGACLEVGVGVEAGGVHRHLLHLNGLVHSALSSTTVQLVAALHVAHRRSFSSYRDLPSIL